MNPLKQLVEDGYSVHLMRNKSGEIFITADHWIRDVHLHARGNTFDVAIDSILPQDIDDLLN